MPVPLPNGSRLTANGDSGGRGPVEPIAVVGMSFRFPDGADNPDAFWKMLVEKRCGAREWLPERANIDAFYSPDADSRDKIYVRESHFLANDIARFDAPFFNMTAQEAAVVDPQQRMLLETTFHALENAGIPMSAAAGSQTAVYSSSMADDYKQIMLKDPDNIPLHSATGATANLLANRISWFYNLHGPSVHMDTACSSSLIGLDVASQGLRNRDSNMALVVSANVLISPELMLSLCNTNILSPDSRCKAFDERANGYSRGEGVGVIVLKRVSDAIRDGDTIRAVVRSAGSNQDGHTPGGITQPSGELQAALIRRTYEKASLNFSPTRYFEAHGTGTALGDPIESSAIGSVFAKHRSPSDPLHIGSVKSNIGHLEAASGLAGLVKAILVLENGVMPPNANFEKLNPKVKTQEWNLKVVTEPTPWPTDGLRRVSVNSFGFGGSNTHVILDDAFHFLQSRGLNGRHRTAAYPPSREALLAQKEALDCPKTELTNGHTEEAAEMKPQPNGTPQTNGISQANGIPQTNGFSKTNGFHQVNGTESAQLSRPRLLVWSAASEKALSRTIEAHSSYCHEHISKSTGSLDEYVHKLNMRTSALKCRSFAVADSLASLDHVEDLASASTRISSTGKFAFIFTGQGAQHRQMGSGLLAYATFRRTMEHCDDVLRETGCPWSIFDVLSSDEADGRINLPDYSQPICTAVQVSLVELLRSFQISPSAVVGHSSGEIAAAYAAGGLDLPSACIVSYYRGVLAARHAEFQSVPEAMMSVNIPEGDIESVLHKAGLDPDALGIHLSCVNSPKNCTISGPEEVLDRFKEHLDSQGIFAAKVRTGVAYHSSRLKDIASKYAAALTGIRPGASGPNPVVMVSSITGAVISDPAQLSTAEYWVRNLMNTVRFNDALSNLLASQESSKGSSDLLKSVGTLLEIGPHPALRRPVADIQENILGQKAMPYFGTLSRFEKGSVSMLKLVGQLFCHGYSVDLAEANQLWSVGGGMDLPELPPYSFDHEQQYWHEGRFSRNYRFRKAVPLDMLGAPMPDWNPLDARWRRLLDVEDTPWIVDHVVSGTPIYPAAGSLVMAIEAAKQMARPDRTITGFFFREVKFSNAIPINFERDERTEVEISLRVLNESLEKESPWFDVRVYLCYQSEWSEACHAIIRPQYEEPVSALDEGREWQHFIDGIRDSVNEAEASCIEEMQPEKWYDFLTTHGLKFGKTFQLVDRVRRTSDYSCVSEINLAASRLPRPGAIHPVVIDAVCHMIWFGPTRGGSQHITTEIPTAMRDVWLSASGWWPPSAQRLHCLTSSRPKDSGRGLLCSIHVTADDGTVLLAMPEMETSPVSGAQAQEEKTLCFDFNWLPDVDLLARHELEAYCKADDSAVAPSQFYGDVERLFDLTIQRVLEEEKLHDGSEKPAHMQKLLDWMSCHGSVNAKGMSLAEISQHQVDLADQIDRMATAGTENRSHFFTTMARNLPSIIAGTSNGLEIMFSDGLVERHYEETFAESNCVRQLERYIRLLAHKQPGLKILEVGAGTGSMTHHIIETCLQCEAASGGAVFQQYDYTDLSVGFFEKAREKFHHVRDRLNFQILDLEKDIAEQGFEVGTYDVVVAGSVLHATQNLSETLSNVRKALRPGGKLLFLEITEPEKIWSPSCFGTLAGWWTSNEPFRQQGPCISTVQWGNLLDEAGFSGNDVVLQDYDDCVSHECSVIVSTAVDATEPPVQSHEFLVVADPQSTYLQDFVCAIQKATKSQSLTFDIATAEDLLSREINEWQTLVYLNELEAPYLHNLSEEQFVSLQALFCRASNLVWISQHHELSSTCPGSGMMDGVARVLRQENTNLNLATIHREDRGPVDNEVFARQVAEILARLEWLQPQGEMEHIIRNGTIHTGRVTEFPQIDREVKARVRPQLKTEQLAHPHPLQLSVGRPGDLESLQFVKAEFDQALQDDEVEVELKAWGLNFRDVLVALGRLEKDAFGLEYAGMVSQVGPACRSIKVGDRVAVVDVGHTGTSIRSKEHLVVQLSDSISFHQAAGIFGPATTAHYCLQEVARLQQDESVLIHSAAGGTGQLAVQIAKLIGAEIFATVGTTAKRQLLIDEYGVPADHIFYSRDTTFSRGIKRMTKGKGVDVILNSLAGEKLVDSWSCLAEFGRFVEIGKADIQANTRLPMSQFAKNTSFAAVDLHHITSTRPARLRRSLEAVSQMLHSGQISVAAPFRVEDVSNITAALRSLQTGKESGKIVVDVNPSSQVQKYVMSSTPAQFRSDATYLIAGGLGGLGRSAAKWMVAKGARNLILLSRSGPVSEPAKQLLNELEHLGATVRAPRCDTSSYDSLADTLAQCADMPPIKGCINGAMALHDALFEKMTWSEWHATVQSKVASSWNLHRLLPSGMDFFIMLASFAGIAGSIGQANYAAGNTYQDALAHQRRRQGEPATSLDLGWMAQVGVMAERDDYRRGKEAEIDFAQISEAEFHAILEQCCAARADGGSDAGAAPSQLVLGLITAADVRAQGLNATVVPPGRTFAFLHSSAAGRADGGTATARASNDGAEFAAAASDDEKAGVVVRGLVHKVSKALSMDPERVEVSKPLHDYGVDSLIAVELRNWFGAEFGADIAIFDIMNAPSIVDIGAEATRRSKLVGTT